MAFVGSSGVLGRRRRVRGGVCGVRMEAEGGGKSVQEKMAEALGRNLEEERKEASVKLEVVEEELRVKMKGAWKKALLGTVLGTSFWAFQHFGLDNPIYLLHAMEEHSPTVQVALQSEKPTLVEFYADWCDSCKSMAKRMFNLEAKYEGRVNFCVVNGDKVENKELLRQFHVDGIPHIALVNSSGKVETTLIGKVPEEYITQDLDALLQGTKLPHLGFDLDDLP